MPQDEPGGYLPTDQVVSGMKAARAWFGLWHETWEPGPRYCPAVHLTCGHPAGESEISKWLKP